MAMNLFKSSDFAVDDNKRMFISPPVECTLSVANGTTETGNIFEIFDNDTTTLYQYQYSISADSVDHTFTITLDFLRKNRAVILWVYYAASHNGNRGAYCTTTLQTSTDNTNWTDLDSVTASAGAGATVTKTYNGADIIFRYIRFSIRAQNGAGAGVCEWRGRINEIYLTPVQ